MLKAKELAKHGQECICIFTCYRQTGKPYMQRRNAYSRKHRIYNDLPSPGAFVALLSLRAHNRETTRHREDTRSMTADEPLYDKPWDYNPYRSSTPLADEFHDAVAALAKKHDNACYQELATLVWKGYAKNLALELFDYDENSRAGSQQLESMLATAREKRQRYQTMYPPSKRGRTGAEAYERKPCDNDYERPLLDEELAGLHNAWMHDMQAWMDQHVLECYQSLAGQEAHLYMRRQFNRYLKNIGLHKQVLMKLIKHQNYITAEGMKELLDALNKYWNGSECENLRRPSRENSSAMKHQGVWTREASSVTGTNPKTIARLRIYHIPASYHAEDQSRGSTTPHLPRIKADEQSRRPFTIFGPRRMQHMRKPRVTAKMQPAQSIPTEKAGRRRALRGQPEPRSTKTL